MWALGKPVGELRAGHGPGELVALELVAAVPGELIPGGLVFHAFGDHP